MALTLNSTRSKGTSARCEVALWVSLCHHLDELVSGHLLVRNTLHSVVLYTEVDGQCGLLKGYHANGLELLHDGVHGGGDHGDLLHKGVPAEVLEVSVAPVAHGGICLINPDVGLDGGLEALEADRELRDDGREVVETNQVGAADDHGDITRENLAHEVVHGDAHTSAAVPAEDTTLNLCIRLHRLGGLSKELLVHAHRRLLHQAAVIRLYDEVEVKARRDLFLLLNHLLDAARLTALAIEGQHLELRVSKAHDYCLCGGLHISIGYHFNFYHTVKEGKEQKKVFCWFLSFVGFFVLLFCWFLSFFLAFYPTLGGHEGLINEVPNVVHAGV